MVSYDDVELVVAVEIGDADWAVVCPDSEIGRGTETTCAVVEEDGLIEIQHVPVRAGQRVQVIVLMPDETGPAALYPLRGREPFRYDDPNEPVGESDWDDAE